MEAKGDNGTVYDVRCETSDHAALSGLGDTDLDLDRIREMWGFPGRYIVSAVAVLGLLYSLLIGRSTEHALKRRMEVVGATTQVVEGQEILAEVVLERHGSVRFRLCDDPEDGYFPNDRDEIIDRVYWSRLRRAGGPRYRGKPKPYWKTELLSPETAPESYELATNKFLRAKEQNCNTPAFLDQRIK